MGYCYKPALHRASPSGSERPRSPNPDGGKRNMDTCICGRPIEDKGARCSRCAALHEIGLEAGATEADIKAAYRAHVKAWHPDRYADDKRQQRTAELKLKKVNAAYDLLTTPEPEPRPPAPPEPWSEPSSEPSSEPRSEPMAARWQEASAQGREQATPYAAWEQYSEPNPSPAATPDFAYSTWAHSRPRPPAPYVDPEAEETEEEFEDSPSSSPSTASPARAQNKLHLWIACDSRRCRHILLEQRAGQAAGNPSCGVYRCCRCRR